MIYNYLHVTKSVHADNTEAWTMIDLKLTVTLYKCIITENNVGKLNLK